MRMLRRADSSPRAVLPNVVCLCVISKFQQLGDLGPSRAVGAKREKQKFPSHQLANSKHLVSQLLRRWIIWPSRHAVINLLIITHTNIYIYIYIYIYIHTHTHTHTHNLYKITMCVCIYWCTLTSTSTIHGIYNIRRLLSRLVDLLARYSLKQSLNLVAFLIIHLVDSLPNCLLHLLQLVGQPLSYLTSNSAE